MGSAAIAGNVTIEDFATIGTNSTILPNLKIGAGAFIGAGAVVTRDVEPNSVYVGVPARKIGENVLELNRKILEEFNSNV
jgi:acetyltransferase-like isoleucine patch superfamily enzyme